MRLVRWVGGQKNISLLKMVFSVAGEDFVSG
jgi:hypothetical protein